MSGIRPLDGLAVLDFCWIGAGALVTKTLAEMGADVYRVESRQRPDNLRLAPPVRPGTTGLEASGYFASRNPGKKSVAINMADERGRAIARQLVRKVDVVTSNFRPGVMERWGLAYEDVATINPRVVYLTMPMQGAEGPHASYIGFGSTIAALSGMVHLSGLPGRTPIGTGTHYPDHVPNPGHALVALLAAIRHQRETDVGQHVELSQFESTVNVLGPAVLETAHGQSSVPLGNRSADASPRGVFHCRDDKWCVIACHTDDQWTALTKVLDLAPPADDGRLATTLGRKRHEDEVEAMVAAAVRTRASDTLLQDLQDAGVPSGLVRSSEDMFLDERLRDRRFWEEVEHPVIETMPISRVPFRFHGCELPEIVRPPLLGEHTWEVLSSLLGMARDEHDRLVADEVLA